MENEGIKNKCSFPECLRTDTTELARTVSGDIWFYCPAHKKEVARIVAKHHADSEHERCIHAFDNNGKCEQANLQELLEIGSEGKQKKTGLFDF